MSGRLNPISRLKSLSKYVVLPLSSYAPRDFVCMSSRAFTLFDNWPEAFFESSGYVRYLKFNLKFHVVQAAILKLCLFPDGARPHKHEEQGPIFILLIDITLIPGVGRPALGRSET